MIYLGHPLFAWAIVLVVLALLLAGTWWQRSRRELPTIAAVADGIALDQPALAEPPEQVADLVRHGSLERGEVF
jgi:hypothetical protein